VGDIVLDIMTAGTARALLAAATFAGLLLAPGCSETREAIVVHPDRIVVSNLTGETWREVELSVNRYYRARFDALPPGGRIDAPLRRFQGGFGRYFDVRREQVKAVRVTATGASGAAVTLDWLAAKDP
jgi:hypothetical protein